MTYIRSRPWRPRGPWFCDRAGARRRGRRNDELNDASAGEMTSAEGLLAEPQDIAEDDVVVAVLDSHPFPERMLATSADYVLEVSSGPLAADRLLQLADRIPDDVIATHILAQQGDDGAPVARQSA